MSRRLADLAPLFRPLAIELLAQLTEAGIMVLITGTGRTAAEQAAYLAAGTSRVVRSRHQDGLAMDVCPYDQYQLHGTDKLQWDGVDPIWMKIGQIGEALGLRWGGRFKPLNTVGVGWDPGHFEYQPPPPPTSPGRIV